jgi:hypothetical protein
MEDIVIKTKSQYDKVSVTEFDGCLWLHLTIRNGTCHVTLTKEQANDLIMGLQTVVAVLEEQHHD